MKVKYVVMGIDDDQSGSRLMLGLSSDLVLVHCPTAFLSSILPHLIPYSSLYTCIDEYIMYNIMANIQMHLMQISFDTESLWLTYYMNLLYVNWYLIL